MNIRVGIFIGLVDGIMVDIGGGMVLMVGVLIGEDTLIKLLMMLVVGLKICWYVNEGWSGDNYWFSGWYYGGYWRWYWVMKYYHSPYKSNNGNWIEDL